MDMRLGYKQAAPSGAVRWVGLALLGLLTLAALWAFASWHVSRTGFWYDESIQLWMSLGLDGFGAPLTPPPGTLRAVIAQNASGNLDPGGFTILLALWMLVTTNEVWLRILPLLFFMAGMIALGLLGWTWRKGILFALFSGLVPAAFPLLLDYSAEVRAYSMEFAGIAIGCLLLAWLIERPDTRLALLAGTVFGAFLTSRYSYALFVTAAVIALAAALPRSPDGIVATYKPLLAFIAPLVVFAAFIFLFLFWPQYKARISYQGGAMLDYLRVATAAGKSAGELASMSAANLLRPAGLPLTLMACVGLFTMVSRRWREATRMGVLAPATILVGILALAALVVNALVWRWHPWDMSQKWSLWLHALSAVAIVRLAASALQLATTPASSGGEKSAWLAALVAVGIIALDLRLASYRRPDTASIVPALTYLDAAKPSPGSVSVDGAWYPTVRQFYEYGSFAGSPLFPTAFRSPYWGAPKPLVTARTRWLITYLPPEKAQAEHPQATIVHDPGLPSQLYRVEPPAVRNSGSTHEQ